MLRQGSFVEPWTWSCVGEWYRLVGDCKTRGARESLKLGANDAVLSIQRG